MYLFGHLGGGGPPASPGLDATAADRQHGAGHAAGRDGVEPIVAAAVVHQQALDGGERQPPHPEVPGWPPAEARLQGGGGRGDQLSHLSR